MIRSHTILLLIPILFGKGSLCAQQPVFKHYTVTDGLPHSTIFRLHQQRNGLLWIGTDNGLCSFDGKNFHLFSPGNSADFNSILGIIDYSPDTLLFYVYKKGYYWLCDQAVTLFHEEIAALRDVIFMKPDHDGKIWLLNTKGDAGFFLHQKFHPFKLPDESLKVNCMEMTPKAVYFGTNAGLFRSDRGRHMAQWDSLAGSEEITGLTFTADHRLWVGTKHHTFELYFKDGEVRKKQEMNFVSAAEILEDATGNKWIRENYRGVWLQRNSLRSPKATEVVSTVVNDMLIDHEGNTWIGTYGQGLYCYTSPGLFNQLEVFQPRVLYESEEGDVFIGAMGQLLVVDNGDLRSFRKIPLAQGKLVTHLFKKGKDSLLISTTGGVFHYGASKIDLLQRTDMSINTSVANPLNPQEVLLGSRGLFTFHDSLEYYIDEVIFDYKVFALCTDNLDKLWIGTADGLFVFDSVALQTMDSGKRILPFWVYDIRVDSGNVVWVATSKGLVRCENEDCKRIAFNNDHFPCKALAMDRHGRIWAGTARGVYHEEDGVFKIAEIPFHESIEDIYDILIDRNDVLWVAASNRIISLNINSMQEERPPPELYLDAVFLGKVPLLHAGLNEIQYDPDFHNLEASFSIVAFSRADQVVCEYRLLGHDPGWQHTGDRRIVYHALEPGDYELELRAKFKNREQFSTSKIVHIRLLPPFYETVWFRGIIIVMLLAIIYLSSHLRQRRIKKRKKEQLIVKMRLNELRHAALNAMMSPHFINNTLNSIEHFVRTKSKLKSSIFISQFSKLIRISLESAFHNRVSLDDEMERLNLFLSLEKMRLEDKFDYTVLVDDDIDAELIKIPNLIIQPLVENAIWHGILPKQQAGKVSVHIEMAGDDVLKIIVFDTGVGFHHSKRGSGHHSMGIDLVLEKLKLSHPDNRLEVEEVINQGEVGGTKVTLSVHIN